MLVKEEKVNNKKVNKCLLVTSGSLVPPAVLYFNTKCENI